MDPTADEAPGRRLRTAIVLSTTEEACTVFGDGHRSVVPFAEPFPRPRTDRVMAGNLVALATATDGSTVVVWRWFDAVVVQEVDRQIRLWEPLHGFVLADRRDPGRTYLPGSRAYLSAGLPGAQWWVAGPAVDVAEKADVELNAVALFFTD